MHQSSQSASDIDECDVTVQEERGDTSDSTDTSEKIDVATLAPADASDNTPILASDDESGSHSSKNDAFKTKAQTVMLLASQTYMQIVVSCEKNIERCLQNLFAHLEDMSKNTVLLFICGLFAGGLCGHALAAFGIMFALSLLNVNYICTLRTGLMLLYFAEAVMYDQYALVGWAHSGYVLSILHMQYITPYTASALTIATVCMISPSFFLACWIVATHLHNMYLLCRALFVES